jgi:hypothetical protein
VGVNFLAKNSCRCGQDLLLACGAMTWGIASQSWIFGYEHEGILIYSIMTARGSLEDCLMTFDDLAL